jgi:hypothetical protein
MSDQTNRLTDEQISSITNIEFERELLRISRDLSGESAQALSDQLITGPEFQGAPSNHTPNKILTSLSEYTPPWRTPFKTVPYGCTGYDLIDPLGWITDGFFGSHVNHGGRI